jgi:hypothetical protein
MGGGTAAAMTIVTSTSMSEHQNIAARGYGGQRMNESDGPICGCPVTQAQ